MDLGDFPPLLVVTGTVQVRGGETRKMTSSSARGAQEKHVSMVKIRSPARQKAMSIATRYMKKIDELRILKTPFGNLVHLEKLPQVKRVITDAESAVAAFNAEDTDDCKLWNALLWEPLRGQRLYALRRWLEAHPEEAQVLSSVLQNDGGEPSGDPPPPVAVESGQEQTTPVVNESTVA